MTEQTWCGAIATHPARPRTAWFPSWPRVVDDGRGLTRNFCATLRTAAAEGAVWTLAAQDDVAPATGLEDALPRILSEIPQGVPVAAFFSLGYRRDVADHQRGVRWRVRRRSELLWIMLVAVRTDHAPILADAVERRPRPADRHGPPHTLTGADERLSLCLDALGVPAVVHIPSLVQHCGEQSLIGHGWRIGGRVRQSPTFHPDHVTTIYP